MLSQKPGARGVVPGAFGPGSCEHARPFGCYYTVTNVWFGVGVGSGGAVLCPGSAEQLMQVSYGVRRAVYGAYL